MGGVTDRDAPRPAPVGRPRDPGIDGAVLGATLDVLEGAGYRGFTLEEVARRARTTKPAIYRRWPTRQHLVLAALAHGVDELRAPDTGCTLCDLVDCINLFVDAFQRLPTDVLGSLLADCADDERLRAAFMAMLFDPPRAAVGRTLDLALARGDLRADVDRELALDLLGSLVHFRAVFGHTRMSDADIERAVETILQGIATDFPRLLEHSRRADGDPEVHHLHS